MISAARNSSIRTRIDDSSTEANAAFKVLEARVGPERIKPRPQEDAGVESLFDRRDKRRNAAESVMEMVMVRLA